MKFVSPATRTSQTALQLTLMTQPQPFTPSTVGRVTGNLVSEQPRPASQPFPPKSNGDITFMPVKVAATGITGTGAQIISKEN